MSPPNRWIYRSLFALTICTLFPACAGVSHRDVLDDSSARGFRYYDSSPYLLVQTDNKGGLTSSISYLPDLTKLRQANPYKFLAKNDSTFQLTNGILTNSDNVGDGTAIPKAFIDAAERVASAAIKANADEPRKRTASEPDTAPRVYLFKIVKTDGEWTLLGAQGPTPLYKFKPQP
jgi:hypothetical protein